MSGGRAQALAAVGLALVAHLGAFGVLPSLSGAVASGEDGAAVIALQAADGTLDALVAAWDQPPEQPPVVAEPVAPVVPAAQAPAPLATPAPPALKAPPIAPAPIAPAAAPDAAYALPPPAPPPVAARPPPAAADAQQVRPPPRPTPTAEARPTQRTAPETARSAARPEQRAAGKGGGEQAGTEGKAQAARITQARANELAAGWGAAIRARIERTKRHPGASGVVTLRLTVGRNGRLTGLSVQRSSGNAAVDAAALDAVRRVGTFPPAPAGLTRASYSFTLPVRFAR